MLFGLVNTLEDLLLMANLFHFALCIILVAYMIYTIRFQDGSHTRQKLLNFMITVLICLFADMASYIFDMQTFPGARLMNHVSMFLSVLSTAFVGTTWLSFFDTIFHIDNYKIRRRIIYFIPTFLTLCMLVINLFTGFIYEIGPDNVYQRGDGYWISFTLQYISFPLILIRSLVPTLDLRTIRRKRMRRAVVWLSLLTVTFGIMQAAMGGKIALHCLGITVGIFIMFIRFQDDQITIDSLTALNNRYALDNFLIDKLKDYASGTKKKQTLYFIMMDLNNFKFINDTYGHQEGDKILRAVANKLKSLGGPYGSRLFLARYAGDEFAAVLETSDKKTLTRLVSEIKSRVSEIKIDDFVMGISVGVATYAGRNMPMEQLQELADKALYIDKFAVKDTDSEE